MKSKITNFENVINSYFKSKSFLFARGRVGLHAILRAMGLNENDEVILPGYTCLVVPTAATVLGIKVKYVDIDPVTYNLNCKYLDSALTSNTKAIIVQHTYGIPCNMEKIVAWAKNKNIPIIEDCCLAFGSKYNNKLCGTFGIASYLSGQWNKPFSTGLGGMLILNDKSYIPKLNEIIDEHLVQPSLNHRLRIKFQIFLYDYLVNPETVQTITEIYRKFSKLGIAIGSSCKEEYEGNVPNKYFMGMTPEQAKRGIYEMSRIDENINHRKTIEKYYEENLPKLGFQTVVLDVVCEPVYVRYPIRVKNKQEVIEKTIKEKVEIGSWFESPLHPEGTDLEKFGYNIGLCPESEKAAKEVINLPTHLKVSIKEAERVLKFLQKYAKPI